MAEAAESRFHIERPLTPHPRIEDVWRAGEQHRLSFLWYAVAARYNGESHEIVYRYERMRTDRREPGSSRPASSLFHYENELNQVAGRAIRTFGEGEGLLWFPPNDGSDGQPYPPIWVIPARGAQLLDDSATWITDLAANLLAQRPSDWRFAPWVHSLASWVVPPTGRWLEKNNVYWAYLTGLTDVLRTTRLISLSDNASDGVGVLPIGGTVAAPIGQQRLPSVILHGIDEPPIVRTRAKPLLTDPEFAVIKALVNAGTRGLSQKELKSRSDVAGVRRILKRLADSDEDWRAVIGFAGTPGNNYRIR